MMFKDRDDVETLGRLGVSQVRDAEGLRARQLNDFWLYVDEQDAGYTKHALDDGYWESWITYWMDVHVPEGSRCLDIGANHGYYSFFLASKGCEVWAAEPQNKLVELIAKSERFNATGQVNILEAAFSDRSGITQMMVPIHHGMNATISSQFSYAPHGYGTVDVNTYTLDEFDKTFDFIKVDAEGAEDLIWAGSKKYRKENPHTLWLMEWRWDRYKEPEAFAKDFLDNYTVSYVEFDGSEEAIESVEHLASKKNEDWMLVLRKG